MSGAPLSHKGATQDPAAHPARGSNGSLSTGGVHALEIMSDDEAASSLGGAARVRGGPGDSLLRPPTAQGNSGAACLSGARPAHCCGDKQACPCCVAVNHLSAAGPCPHCRCPAHPTPEAQLHGGDVLPRGGAAVCRPKPDGAQPHSNCPGWVSVRQGSEGGWSGRAAGAAPALRLALDASGAGAGPMLQGHAMSLSTHTHTLLLLAQTLGLTTRSATSTWAATLLPPFTWSVPPPPCCSATSLTQSTAATCCSRRCCWVGGARRAWVRCWLFGRRFRSDGPQQHRGTALRGTWSKCFLPKHFTLCALILPHALRRPPCLLQARAPAS